jgi:molybdopterin-binding protein
MGRLPDLPNQTRSLGCQRGLWFDDRGRPNLSQQEMEFSMKISARNQLKGTIVDVVKGATTSHIRIDIGGGVIVTSAITNEAVDELKLAKGKAAVAVIKASDVMVGVD